MEKYEILENSNKVIELDADSVTMLQINENDENENDNAGIGRTYECTYCKRGFTNAQALGGHMNIHRKDKAKSKKRENNYSYISSPSFIYKNNKGLPFSSYNNSNYNYNYNNPSIVPQRSITYGAIDPYKSPYYPFALANPNYSSQKSIYSGKNNNHDLLSGGNNNWVGMHEENLGMDLSLRMGSSSSSMGINHLHQGDEYKKDDHKCGAIDLELRLGYDP
ncbi:hypothetical protein vseg_011748 [Gypsophila vaccaria]